MAISQGHKTNFNTLVDAIQNGDACVMECTDRATKKPVNVICAVNVVDGEYQMVPLARLFDGNPYEELIPPDANPEN